MTLYDDDVEARALLRSFYSLALLPIDRIQEGFELLKRNSLESTSKQQLTPFVSYFEHEWIHHFQPAMWSVDKKKWRTNNHAEGNDVSTERGCTYTEWELPYLNELISAQNNRFSSRVVQPYPNLWRFIQCLKQEESVISHRMVQTGLGFSSSKPTKSTRQAVRKTKQVQKLVQLLESQTRSLSDTLASLAHIVGEPVGRGRKKQKKKHNVSHSDISDSTSDHE